MDYSGPQASVAFNFHPAEAASETECAGNETLIQFFLSLHMLSFISHIHSRVSHSFILLNRN